MNAKTKIFALLWTVTFYFLVSAIGLQGDETRQPVRFNTNFPGAALGKIEYLGNETYRCAVDGQYNQYGRNRQATWFCFRLDDALDRSITIRLTNLKGEYNNRPTRGDWSKERPVYSYDQIHWTLIEQYSWDAESGEFSFSIKPKQDSVWIAYTPLYVPAHLEKLLGDVADSPRVRTEVLGKSVHHRDIYELTITDFTVADTQKRHYWIVARLHAWEALTSWVAEGLVRFLCDVHSEEAATICRQAVVHVVVMPDPDGCIRGMVRYNLNGFDTNRNWASIDLQSKESLRDRTEVWYLKKAIYLSHLAKPIDVVFNLHNHQTTYDFLSLSGDGKELLQWYAAFETAMEDAPFFKTNPKSRNRIDTTRVAGGRPFGSADELWDEFAIPHVLIEYNINRKADTEYWLSVSDALKNGEKLIKNIHFSYPTPKKPEE